MTINRWSIEALRWKPSSRCSWEAKRGPYGSRSIWVTVFGKTVCVVRRYPDDRLRCERCGYRRNDDTGGT